MKVPNIYIYIETQPNLNHSFFRKKQMKCIELLYRNLERQVAALTTSTFRIISTPYVLSEHEKISSLIGPQSGTWRAYMIRQMFSSDDICATLSIPLSLRLPRDQMVWAYNPKGEFTVRSTYKVVMAASPSSAYGVPSEC